MTHNFNLYLFFVNATQYSKVQQFAAARNTGQHTTTHCNILQRGRPCMYTRHFIAPTHTHTQHQWNTLQHTATHCHPLRHTTTHYNTLQQSATHFVVPLHTHLLQLIVQHTATQRQKAQHNATHYNTPHCANSRKRPSVHSAAPNNCVSSTANDAFLHPPCPEWLCRV